MQTLKINQKTTSFCRILRDNY